MRLCDVTLCASSRGRERTPTVDQRVEAGRALDRLEVPFVCAGTPADSEADHETIRRLSGDLAADVVARSSHELESVETALEAEPDLVEVTVPVSDPRLARTLGGSRDEAFDAAESAVLRAREGGVDVHLALADAFRAEIPAIAGAFGRFDCPIVLEDTVGARTPPFAAGFLRTLADASADLTRAGVRFRDDLGCATANAIVAAETGVDRIDASVAGLGRRAGNAATEEVVVATEIGGGDAGVALEETIPACEDVLRALGESVERRKAVLGESATTRETGTNAAATLEEPSAFEPFDPRTFGGRRRVLFDERTDRAAALKLLERAGRGTEEGSAEALLERLAEEGPVELEAALALAEEV